MNTKEAKIILQCRGNGYSEDEFNEALEIAYSAIDSSLLSNIYDIAEKYAEKMDISKGWFDGGEIDDLIKESFQAGAEWAMKRKEDKK